MSSISAVTANTDPYASNVQPNSKQLKSDFKALAEALQSGSLTDAQQAIATLKKDAPNLFNADTSQANSASDPLTTLANALQSGDLKSAQTAFASLQQKVSGHHHHHHHRGAAAAPASTPTTTSAVDSTGTVGSQINTSA
jgi:hypothetical protein